MPMNSSPVFNDLAGNFRDVERAITDACIKAGRARADVKLVAVSKGHDFSKIEALYDLGQRHFGESYAREFHEKFGEAKRRGLDVVWHFIGALQSNKFHVIKDAHVIESISSLRHAQMLDAVVDGPRDIFLQINLADVKHQQGVGENDVLNIAQSMTSLKNLHLRGLMTIAPLNTSVSQASWFQKMAVLKEQLHAQGVIATIALSMGMSDDFVEAICHGSNYVRIGTRIFGAR